MTLDQLRSQLTLFTRPELEAYAVRHPDCSQEELSAAVSAELQKRYVSSRLLSELLKAVERQAPTVHLLLVATRQAPTISTPGELAEITAADLNACAKGYE